ncbi:hypothetical protein RRG08_017672 [Elysia crispata]|uniref:Uncharacterized protein n=1 Tax=Elysia crispata TaxID=231223 RepID=A0AAE1DD87_9GAST|nr:hypothetical protein RRG08_017672 [Elysia crispata]
MHYQAPVHCETFLPTSSILSGSHSIKKFESYLYHLIYLIFPQDNIYLRLSASWRATLGTGNSPSKSLAEEPWSVLHVAAPNFSGRKQLKSFKLRPDLPKTALAVRGTNWSEP